MVPISEVKIHRFKTNKELDAWKAANAERFPDALVAHHTWNSRPNEDLLASLVCYRRPDNIHCEYAEQVTDIIVLPNDTWHFGDQLEKPDPGCVKLEARKIAATILRK